MVHLRIQAYAAIIICLLPGLETCGAESEPKRPQTGTLGGVPNPDKAALLAMHNGSYILHARGGKLTQVAVEKHSLPPDPKSSGQILGYGGAVMAPDGTIYVKQATLMSKSTDGGRTWTSHPHFDYDPNFLIQFQVLKDGTFIAVGIPHIKGDPLWRKPANVWTSSDEGKSWRKIAEIPRPTEFDGVEYEWWYVTYALHVLPDGTVLWAVQLSNTVNISPPYKSTLVMYRSKDDGKTWQGPSTFAHSSSEGGMTRTASGKLLAVVRHQRLLLSDDPPWLKTESAARGYKNVFLADSLDQGRTWQNFRPLTTVYGQCYGFPAALSDGTVVVVHDTRYGPGPSGSRAMISHDEGQTWEDEVYYLDANGGYSQSLVLEDDAILTFAPGNNNEIMSIRWKPVNNK